MDFDVYCDESGLEALLDKKAHTYTIIGGIWFPSDYRQEFKKRMLEIKNAFNISGELKWQKVSPAYASLYQSILEFYFKSDQIRFRAIAIEAAKVDNIKFNNEDAELGFYKFYYQLLHHWIFDFNEYQIFIDLKVNRKKDRLSELKRVLRAANLTSNIKEVQGLHSEESLGIQLADILTGLVGSKMNGKSLVGPKSGLIR